MGATLSQLWPPKPTLTERNIQSQKGKVFLITGANSGIGLEMTKILYDAGATIYMACRTQDKTEAAMKGIVSGAKAPKDSTGRLEFLQLDLSDLSSIKSSAATFLSKESKLDVLFNNAGISQPPAGLVSAQGHDIQIATNCFGPLLFTDLVLPALRAAAPCSTPGAVRIVWTSSQMVDLAAGKDGFSMSDMQNPPKDNTQIYTNTKTGNWFLASEVGKRVDADGILSITQNPGGLKTNVLRTAPKWMMWISWPMLWPPIYGAYTELWTGLSPELGMADQGAYIIPWGRKHPGQRKDLHLALKDKEEGGSGRAGEFYEWCEEMIKDYR
ncbi:NAD(P)-binding protein [Microthyrium microscopicum]|uniref:NAD(P)-binding protein n=1 Tax=Microthyrium microscopicum TaxID=703497 RepID=A0A6A6UU85_9PEZI|nr:NAD(P)-binding protein [Microthyrium microscopicum]